MLFLIDGHNLIQALPDLALDDPDDEAKLVEKLKAYCGRLGKKAVVVFDHGLPGGQSHDLSTGQIKVIFAAAHHTTADRIILERLRKARGGEYILVSSDRVLRDDASARRIEILTSEMFAAKMAAAFARRQTPRDPEDEKPVSKQEVDYWLRAFQADERDDADER